MDNVALCVRTCTDELVKLNAIEPISARLRPSAEYDAALEAALSTLTILTATVADATDDIGAHARAQCHQERLGVHAKLTEIVRVGSGKGECLEAVEYARCLLQRLFAATPAAAGSDGQVVDR